jgi:predicted AlkP superfamily pyrophosphatase or phosphodiesterase
VYNVEDEDSPILGYPEFYGRSPRNSYREGLADWTLNRDDDARVVSISLKDRAAIGLSSKAKGDVFWILLDDGQFATSEFYFDDYPKWIERFNEDVMPGLYADTIWESEIPEHLEYLSRPDTSRAEHDGIHSYFPHLARAEMTSDGDPAWMEWRSELSPFPDRAVLTLAREAVRERRLGQREEVDYLGISLSQTDKIGHRYGPMSREQLDNLIRLDRELEVFSRFLDETVEEDRWVMAFSSDHGTSDVQEYLPEPVPRFGAEMQSRLNEALREAVSGGGAAEDVRSRMVRRFKELEFVEDAWSVRELQSGSPADSFAVLYRNSLSTERFWGLLGRYQIQVRWIPGLKPGYLRGTNHESPYYSDRWVPLIFYGAGVPAGSTDRPVASVDVAPTLAALAGIAVPNDLDGVALLP